MSAGWPIDRDRISVAGALVRDVPFAITTPIPPAGFSVLHSIHESAGTMSLRAIAKALNAGTVATDVIT